MSETQTKTEKTETTPPFWRFSLCFYRQSGVSDACIALQDDCGVDVNLLLFLFWLAADGQLLSADEVKKLDEKVRDWRNLTVIPIRDARRKLKGAPTLVDPTKQEAFRTMVKAVELDAERLQQEIAEVGAEEAYPVVDGVGTGDFSSGGRVEGRVSGVPGGQRQKHKQRNKQQHKPQKQVQVTASRWRKNNANGLHGGAFPLSRPRVLVAGRPVRAARKIPEQL